MALLSLRSRELKRERKRDVRSFIKERERERVKSRSGDRLIGPIIHRDIIVIVYRRVYAADDGRRAKSGTKWRAVQNVIDRFGDFCLSVALQKLYIDASARIGNFCFR